MNLISELAKAIRVTLALWVLVAVIYPVILLGVGQVAFSEQANGSMLKNAQGVVVGSALIGQPFKSDRYFNGRPSTPNYSTANPQNDTAGILKTGVSGASNLAASNPALIDRIQGVGTSAQPQQSSTQPTADLLYASASGLDPHITPAAAQSQIARVAIARGLQPNQLETLIVQNTDGRSLGLWGEPGVNVLKLNLALDSL